jgi:predicted nucleotidyltransferase
MNLPNNIKQAIIDAITDVVEAEEIYIFGSYARGEETPDSDIDIYAICKQSENLPLYEACGQIRYRMLYSLKGYQKDLLLATREQFDRNKEIFNSVEEAIVSEGVKIYG